MRGLQDTTATTEMPIHHQWMERARRLPEELANRYARLSKRHQLMLFGAGILNVCILIAIIIITPHRIGQWINTFAHNVRGMGAWGMLLTVGLVILTSHPPLFGFSASMTLIGFAYGIWPGFLLAVVSSMLGAGIAFVSVRRFFPNLIKPNRKWDAFGRVMREKGTVLVCMIRYCPIPWAMGNGLFASIESVKLWQYMLANLLIQPRLLIPVFIGSRLTSLSGGSSEPSDPDSPAEPQDPAHFWLNIISICLSLCISSGTGIWIYRLTARQMKKYEHVPGEGEDAMDGLEEGLLAAAYADDLARATGEDDGEGLVPRPQGKGRVASYGFGEIVRGEGYRDDESGEDGVASMGKGSGRSVRAGMGKGPRASPSAVGEDGVEVVGMVRRSSSHSAHG